MSDFLPLVVLYESTISVSVSSWSIEEFETNVEKTLIFYTPSIWNLFISVINNKHRENSYNSTKNIKLCNYEIYHLIRNSSGLGILTQNHWKFVYVG